MCADELGWAGWVCNSSGNGVLPNPHSPGGGLSVPHRRMGGGGERRAADSSQRALRDTGVIMANVSATVRGARGRDAGGRGG